MCTDNYSKYHPLATSSLRFSIVIFSVSFVFLFRVGVDGEETLEGPIEEVARLEAHEAEDLLRDLGIPVSGEPTYFRHFFRHF